MCSVRIAPALRVGDAFRAGFGSLNPRLKPWAVLSDHFMVENHPARRSNHQSPFTDY
jgi:hypothetical protein